MGFFNCLFNDVVDKVKRNSAVVFISVLLFVVGLIIGIVISSGNCSCWWCVGRSNFVRLMCIGNYFKYLFRVLFNFLLLGVLLCLLSTNNYLNYVKFVLCAILGLFVGAYVTVTTALLGFWGVVSSLLIFVFVGLLCLVSIIVSFIDIAQVCSLNFKDAFILNKQALVVLLIAFVINVLFSLVFARLFVVSI